MYVVAVGSRNELKMGKEADLLQAAVKAGDVVTVQKILCKATSNSKTNSSMKQSSLNQQDTDGLSVLHHAALVGDNTLIKLLLANGISIDAKDNKGLRPLHYAAWLGKDQPVQLLLHCGSCVNEPASDGTTPLHMACEHGHIDAVEKLLVYKGDPSLQNNQSKTPLDLACEFGRKHVAELLLTSKFLLKLRLESYTDILDNNKTTCLHLAARNGHVDIVRLLIEFGFNINQQTPQGTCLHEAAKYGKTDVVRFLLANGVDVSRLNSYEETALEIVNKFTATRAAKELKQILKEASSELLAQAVRDYSMPLDASHLAFKEGDIIMVVDHFSENGLWKGYCASTGGHVTHIGCFPSEAVIIIDPSNTNRDSGLSSDNSCIGHCFNPTECTDGQQNRLSGQSSESGVSSYQPSSCSPVSSSHNSLECPEDSSFSSSSLKAHEATNSIELSEIDLLSTWLRNFHLDEYIHMFVNAGYDLQTISRMTPEDLTAIGITHPSARKKLTSEIARLTIPDGIPDYRPRGVKEWLDILRLSEYYDLLIHQGYNGIDSIIGIMWEDLEEIGIKKLGHQKKIMLAIDRLKKVVGASQPPTSSGEPLAPSGIPSHSASILPPRSLASHQFCSANSGPSYDVKRCLNVNLSGEMVNPSPSSVAATPFGVGFSHPMPRINHFNLPLSSCQTCSSFRTRTCDDEVIGPAPPLPVRETVNSDFALTKQGIFSYRKEVENLAYFSHLQQDWCPVTRIQSKGEERSYDFDLSGKGYHFTAYGTLPRRPVHRGHGFSHFLNESVEVNETEALPFPNEEAMNKSPLAPKCLNPSKINAHPFKTTGEKQSLYHNSSVQKFCTSKHQLDAFNLEGIFQNYSGKNYGQSVLSNSAYPERSFVDSSMNETMATTSNYSMHCSVVLANQCGDIFEKETLNNSEIKKASKENCEQTPHSQHDTSLVSCQNLSSVSLNSSDSSGTFDGSSLPFASEDYGTIKERTAVQFASDITAEDSSNGHRDSDKVVDGRNTTAKFSLKSATANNCIHDSKDKILSDAASMNHQSSSSNLAKEAVFDDIDGMLLGLTQELDEMLKHRV